MSPLSGERYLRTVPQKHASADKMTTEMRDNCRSLSRMPTNLAVAMWHHPIFPNFLIYRINWKPISAELQEVAGTTSPKASFTNLKAILF